MSGQHLGSGVSHPENTPSSNAQTFCDPGQQSCYLYTSASPPVKWYLTLGLRETIQRKHSKEFLTYKGALSIHLALLPIISCRKNKAEPTVKLEIYTQCYEYIFSNLKKIVCGKSLYVTEFVLYINKNSCLSSFMV